MPVMISLSLSSASTCIRILLFHFVLGRFWLKINLSTSLVSSVQASGISFKSISLDMTSEANKKEGFVEATRDSRKIDFSEGTSNDDFYSLWLALFEAAHEKSYETIVSV